MFPQNPRPREFKISFTKSLYEGAISDQKVLNLEKIVIRAETFTEAVRVQLTGRHRKFFTFTQSANEIEVSFTRDLSLDSMADVQYLQLSFTVSADGYRSAIANIVNESSYTEKPRKHSSGLIVAVYVLRISLMLLIVIGILLVCCRNKNKESPRTNNDETDKQ
jgi:hypothetical protein